MPRRSSLDTLDAVTDGALARRLVELRASGRTYLQVAADIRAEFRIEVDPTTARRWLVELERRAA